MKNPVSVVIIGYVWPEPKSSAAGMREMSLIKTFQEAGWNVSYFSPSKDSEYRKNLEEIGVSTEVIEANNPKFDELIKKLSPQIVIFDRFVIEEQFGWRVQEILPHCLRVLDTQDIHFLRRSRMNRLFGKDEVKDDMLRELASIYRSDLTLVLSDFELALLNHDYNIPQALLFHLPFQYPEISTDNLPSFNERNHFVMIGNFRHPPNHDGALWFVSSIWPKVRAALPSVELHLFGAYAPREISSLNNPKIGIYVKGWAENQYEEMQKYRINLAPLRFGAGIKGKIADGWFCGTPVVTTPIGSEGMSCGLPFGGIEVPLNENVEHHFAAAAIELYSNQTKWKIFQMSGFNIIENVHSHKKNSVKLLHQLEKCLENISIGRSNNLIGEILNFHHHRSTKYFSKWIEIKQKYKVPK